MLFDLSVYAGKTAVVLLFLFIGFRLLGKRQAAQLNLYDLATVIAIANAVQNAMTRGKGDLAVGITCSTTLIGLCWLIARLVARTPKLQGGVYGIPTVLLSKGQVLNDKLKNEHVTFDELSAVMRQHGLTTPAEVELAVLEVDGTISIIPRSQNSKKERE